MYPRNLKIRNPITNGVFSLEGADYADYNEKLRSILIKKGEGLVAYLNFTNTPYSDEEIAAILWILSDIIYNEDGVPKGFNWEDSILAYLSTEPDTEGQSKKKKSENTSA